MANIIKSAKEFKIISLLENNKLNEMRSDALDKFYEDAEDIIRNEIGDTSYSVLAADRATKSRINRNPEDDFKKMMSALGEAGWTKENLKTLFDNEGKEITEDYNNNYVPGILLCGVMDYFLYKMIGDDILLMGYNTKDIGDDVDNAYEASIKFNYGYNRTPYGTIAMIQHFGSVEAFIDYTGENFPKAFSMYNGDIVLNVFINKYTYDKSTKVGTIDIKNIAEKLKKELIETLFQIGTPVVETPPETITSGGYSEIDGDEIKIYFNEKNT